MSKAGAGRDEFPRSVKGILAARVSYRCSNPACRASTSGPQLDDEGFVNVGVAAHITAASPGGPRFDPALSAEERTAIDNAIWVCQNCAKMIDSDIKRFSVQILHQWKRKAEYVAFEELGKTIQRPAVDSPKWKHAEEEIRRNLQVRDALRTALLKPYVGNEPERKHRYENFRTAKLIIRSLEDRTYPGIDDDSTDISGWFRVEPYDFYHNGLEVTLRLLGGIVNDSGEWKIINAKDQFDEAKFRRQNIILVGRIPFTYIRAYDLRGDEYYNEPHLYCAFANNGEPYEGFRYIAAGAKDEYDWPLNSDRQLP
jgi:hypothetical protein